MLDVLTVGPVDRICRWEGVEGLCPSFCISDSALLDGAPVGKGLGSKGWMQFEVESPH